MQFESYAVEVIEDSLAKSSLGPGGLAVATGLDGRRLASVMACKDAMSVDEFVRICRALDLGLDDFAAAPREGGC